MDNDYRSRGIGRQLLHAALDRLSKTQDCHVVVLEKNNQARQFYERMGFTTNLGISNSETKYGPIREVTLVRKTE